MQPFQEKHRDRRHATGGRRQAGGGVLRASIASFTFLERKS
jgi:hypothetical protein